MASNPPICNTLASKGEIIALCQLLELTIDNDMVARQEHIESMYASEWMQQNLAGQHIDTYIKMARWSTIEAFFRRRDVLRCQTADVFFDLRYNLCINRRRLNVVASIFGRYGEAKIGKCDYAITPFGTPTPPNRKG